jgi:molecular chaperone GrpE
MHEHHCHELDALKKELAEAKTLANKMNTRAEENLDGWKRAKADYSNLKRDAEREKTEIAGFAVGALLFELLPVIDNMDRAIAHCPKGEKESEWSKGILAIHQQLQTFLKDMGLERVPTEGTFDPEIHEAIAHEEQPSAAEGSILEVVTPGYRMHGKLLRPARVKVAKAAEKPSEPQTDEKDGKNKK